jgi:hypothetical protein
MDSVSDSQVSKPGPFYLPTFITSSFLIPRRPQRRFPLLTIRRKRRRLMRRSTSDVYHPRLTYQQATDLGVMSACRKTHFNAFKQENLHRWKATENPLLITHHKEARLQWTMEHQHWDLEPWKRFLPD